MTCLFKYFAIAQLVLVVAFALPLPIDNNKDVHHRVKRQYFKPSIDGNILGDERKVMPTKPSHPTANKHSSTDPTTTTTFSLNDSNSNNNSNNSISANSQRFNEVTVTSLSLSLINLFDRVKGTLCQIIGQNCK